MEARRLVVRADVFGPRRPPSQAVLCLRVADGAVAVAGEGAAHVQTMDGGGHGAREIRHAVVRVGRAVRSFAIDHGGLQRQRGYVPVRLDADVAPRHVHDARALGRLQGRRAEQRFQGQRHAELAYRAAPARVTQPDPEVGRRQREGRAGGRRRRADGAHLDLGAERGPSCDLAFDREPGAPEKEGSGVPERLEAGLQVSRDTYARSGGCPGGRLGAGGRGDGG